jgi:hypothetical protein
MELLWSCLAWTQPWLQAGKYMSALISELPSRNGWSFAEYAGDRAPDRSQRLLSRASWDERAAMSLVRKYAVAGLDEAARRSRRRRMTVGALDKTGQEKQGRQCGGEAAVHGLCGPGRERDQHGAPVLRAGEDRPRTGRRTVVEPAGDIADPVKSLVTGLPLDLRFRTKGQLAIDILDEAYADGLAFDFVCGDEVLISRMVSVINPGLAGGLSSDLADGSAWVLVRLLSWAAVIGQIARAAA